MNFGGISPYQQDPLMRMMNEQTRSLTNLGQTGNLSSMNSGFMPGSYGANSLMPGTSLLNQNMAFGINNGMGFSSNQNMFAQPMNTMNLDNSVDVGKAARGFGKGLILNPLKNMLGTPTKAAMTLGTMGIAAAACTFPLTAPVAIPVCAALAVWGGIQGAVKLISGVGKATEAASKGDGQNFEKAFEEVGEGTFNIAGAALAAKGMQKATGKGPINTLKTSWNDGVGAVKNFKMSDINFKMPEINLPNLGGVKNWASNLAGKASEVPPATVTSTSVGTAATPITTNVAPPTTGTIVTSAPSATLPPVQNVTPAITPTVAPNAQIPTTEVTPAPQGLFGQLMNTVKSILPKGNQNPLSNANSQTLPTGTTVQQTAGKEITFWKGFDISKNTVAGLNTDPQTAQKQMMEDIKGQIAQGSINPAALPAQLQQQLGLANDPQFKQYLNPTM